MRPDPSQMNNEQFQAWVAEEIEKAAPAYNAPREAELPKEKDWSQEWNACEDADGVIEESRQLKAMHADLSAIDKVMQGIEEIDINGKLSFISLYLDDLWTCGEHWMSVVFIDGSTSYLLKWIVDGRTRFGSRLYRKYKEELIDLAKRKIATLEGTECGVS